MTDPLWEQALQLLTVDYPLLQVARQFSAATPWNRDEVRRLSLELNLSYLQAVGGLQGALPLSKADLNTKLLEALRALLSNAEFTSAMSYTGDSFSYSSDEVDQIMSRLEVGHSKFGHFVVKDQLYLA